MTRFEKCWGIYTGKGLARAKPFPVQISQHFSNLVIIHTYLPMKMGQIECSETSAYKIQTPGNYPEESIQQVIGYNYFLQLFETMLSHLSLSSY